MESFRQRPSQASVRSRAASSVRGFSLLELLVGIAIVGILASIAIPSYERYVMRSRRSAAEQLMTTIANREAQYLLDARAFTDTVGAGGLNMTNPEGWTCAATCTNANYAISVALVGSGFTVTGTPSGKQATDGVLRLTSSGQRSRTISGADRGW